MQVVPLRLGHDSLVELSDLVVLGRIALVLVVALTGDDVVGNLIWSLSRFRHVGRGTLLRHRAVVGRRVAVRVVLRLAAVVGVDAHAEL